MHLTYFYLLCLFLLTKDILAITTLQHCPKYKITPSSQTHNVSTRKPPIKPYAWNLVPSERILLLTARFKVVRPIPIRKDPGKRGLNGTFLLGKRACNKRAIKEKPISGIAN